MKKILLRGPFLTQSGYGVHARQIFKWVKSLGVNFDVQVLPWGDTSWYTNPSELDGMIGEIMMKTKPIEGQYDVSIQLQLPNEWDTKLAKFNVGVTAAVETDKCNPRWIECCNAMDVVVVPSKFTKNVIMNTATAFGLKVREPHVVGETFNEAAYHSNYDTGIDFQTTCNFLIFGQLVARDDDMDRKNVLRAIKLLSTTFSDDPDVGIVIKTNSGRNSLIDRKVTIGSLKTVLDKIPHPRPPVYLLHGNMSDEEVYSLYKSNKLTALVAPTKGEGFGLPILEAAACNLPVIATNWSGHLDFLESGKFSPIAYKLKQIAPQRVDNNIFMTGTRWADIDNDDFVKRVKRIRANSAEARSNALVLGENVRKKFSEHAIFTQWSSAVGYALADSAK